MTQRSNAKQHFEINARGLTFTETCHGAGIGAWSKMMDRINERLFGTTNVSLAALDKTEDGVSVMTLRCRATERRVVAIVREIQAL